MNKKIIFSVIILLLISFFTFFREVPNTQSLATNTANRTNHDTYVALGIYDSNDNLIDNGSNLGIKNNTRLFHTIDIEQNLEKDREYLLIAMIDFKQVSFNIEGKTYNNYKFKVDKSGKIAFNLEIDIPDKSKELDYIIMKEPDYVPNKENYKDSIPLQYIMTSRFNLDDFPYTINYEDNVTCSYEGPYDDIWISDKKEELSAVYKITKGSQLYMTIGNDRNYDLEFAVVLFSNWNQINIDDDIIKYFKVNSGEKKTFEFKIPDIESNKIIQSIAFPRPYKVNSNDRDSTTSSGSFRFIVDK